MFYYEKEKNMLKKITIILGVTLCEFLVSSILFYFISVSFGAYLIEDFLKTTFFSCFMTSICLMPSFILIKHKNPIELINRMFVHKEMRNKLEEFLVNISFGSICGAWFGALVIPLDWDRWWQEWPLSCCIGAIIGLIFGVLFNLVKTPYKTKLHL